MKKSGYIIGMTYIAFALYFVVDDFYFRSFRAIINQWINQIGISHILAYAAFGWPLFLAVILIHGGDKCRDSLGLNRSFPKGMLFALACTLPMLIGYGIVFDRVEVQLNSILIQVVAAAFFEELYFRGFLFGQVYRYTKLGFIPSVALGAILFAFVHIYQSSDIGTLIGIVSTTFLGAVLFSWVFSEWNFNIWVPIGLHAFMNLFWMLFDVSDNAFGNLYGNIFRIISLILIISFTVVYKIRKKIPLVITWKTLWLKQQASLNTGSAH